MSIENTVHAAQGIYVWLEQIVVYQLNKISREISDRDWGAFLNEWYFYFSSTIVLLAFLIDYLYWANKQKSLKAGYAKCALSRVLSPSTINRRMDILLFIYNKLSIDAIVVTLLTILGPIFIYVFILDNFSLNLLSGTGHPFVHAFIFLIAQDFVWYWFHRWAHEHPRLWRIHRFHHAACEMNIITGVRDHPFEKALQTAFYAVPIAIIGAPAEPVVFFIVLRQILAMFLHSEIPWSYGALGKIIVSPKFHQIHHSKKNEHWNKNYGVVFSIWDHIFNTTHKGKDLVPDYGITDPDLNSKSLIHDLSLPLIEFFSPARSWKTSRQYANLESRSAQSG